MERKAVEQQFSNLNDEIENLKCEKKKIRSLVDEKDAQILEKEQELANMEKEVKSLLQVRL